MRRHSIIATYISSILWYVVILRSQEQADLALTMWTPTLPHIFTHTLIPYHIKCLRIAKRFDSGAPILVVLLFQGAKVTNMSIYKFSLLLCSVAILLSDTGHEKTSTYLRVSIHSQYLCLLYGTCQHQLGWFNALRIWQTHKWK